MADRAGNEAAGPPGQSRTIEFSVSSGLGVLRLNRPEAHNALDPTSRKTSTRRRCDAPRTPH